VSFYAVIMKRRTTETETEMAKRIGQGRATLRSWRFVQPSAQKIADVAKNLREDPGDLFREYVDDCHASNPEQCSSEHPGNHCAERDG